MLGIILIAILAILGFYLLGDVLVRRFLCRGFTEAIIVQAANQEKLNDKGRTKAVKFPCYQFTVQGRTVLVKDYNAGKTKPGALGDRVPLYYWPKKPETLWYVSGRLWPDAVYGIAALAGALALTLLY